CMYWDVLLQRWSSRGCWLGSNSSLTHIHCFCNHLTSFGGDFFVPPNPIDFNKVWSAFTSLDQSNNVVVLATVCLMFALYALGLVFARRADQRDKQKVVNTTIRLNESNQDSSEKRYKIFIQTGAWRASGTTASVGLILYGENGASQPIFLSKPEHANEIFFARGSINIFNILLGQDLGSLIKIRVWHDNSGGSPDWFLTQVIAEDTTTKKKKHFLFNRWLSVAKGDCKIAAEVRAYSQDDKDRFRHLFYLRTDKGFGEGHLWLSVLTRPPQNHFTRCQRLSCCMSILFAAMITSAMFYN
ncbi:predicted protein, partial [Nematostella vectensis]